MDACYASLSSQTPFNAEELANNSRRFALLYVSLEEHYGPDVKDFRVKPKLHQFQEMCEMGHSNPSQSWTYRDEDFGGYGAATARRKGGVYTPAAV